jgi:hypothetical protein
MLESSIERKTCAWARERGVLMLKLNTPGRRGWPDRMFIFDGLVAFIEFKRPGEKPVPIQEYVMELLRQQGMSVAVMTNSEKAIEYLRQNLGC